MDDATLSVRPCGCAPDFHPGLTHAEHMALVDFDLTLADLEYLLTRLASNGNAAPDSDLVLLVMQGLLLALQQRYPDQASERFIQAWNERATRLRDWYARLRAQAGTLWEQRHG